jgi:hypothetical protein
MRKAANLVLSLSLMAALAGCSTHRTTTQEVAYDRQTGEPVTVQRETTSTTSEGGGVLSSTVDVVGEVVSLPFRAVGALFRAIF